MKLWMRLLVWLGLMPSDSIEEESRHGGTVPGGSGKGAERPAKARNAGLGIGGSTDPYAVWPEDHAEAEHRRLVRLEREQEEEAKRKAREEARQRREAQDAQSRSIWDDLERKGQEFRKVEARAKADRIIEAEKPTDQMWQGSRMSP